MQGLFIDFYVLHMKGTVLNLVVMILFEAIDSCDNGCLVWDLCHCVQATQGAFISLDHSLAPSQ